MRSSWFSLCEKNSCGLVDALLCDTAVGTAASPSRGHALKVSGRMRLAVFVRCWCTAWRTSGLEGDAATSRRGGGITGRGNGRGGAGAFFVVANVDTIATSALFRARDFLIAPARCLTWKSLLIGAHQQG